MKRCLLCLMTLILVFQLFSVMAHACDLAKDMQFSEHFGMGWSTGVNTRNFVVQVHSEDFHDKVSWGFSIEVWNDIVSGVNFTTLIKSTSTAAYTGDIVMDSVALTYGEMGRTNYYRYNNGTGSYSMITNQDTSTALINQVRISLSPLLLNSGSDYRNRVIMHEIGHAIFLRHPLDFGCKKSAVMQQSNTTYYSNEVMPHDINCLVSKWS